MIPAWLSLSLFLAVASASPMIGSYWTAYDPAFPVAMLDFSTVKEIAYFAAGISSNATLSINAATAKQLVQTAHQSKANATLVVGGWANSAYFSPIAANATLVSTFANNIKTAISTHGFDGVQIDWEYPSTPGAAGNAYSPADSTNYIAMLKTLRQTLGDKVQLSVAGGFDGLANIDNYAEYASYVDYLMLLAFNMETTGSDLVAPTAPLVVCNKAANNASVSSAVALYKSKGFPANKLVLGIPSFGYMYPLKEAVVNPGAETLPSQAWDSSLFSSEITFADLINENALQMDGLTPGRNSNWTRYYDDCTQTPVLYNAGYNMVVTYDDPQSVMMKSLFAEMQGLGGVMMFAASGDHSNLLAKAAQSGLKGPPPTTATATVVAAATPTQRVAAYSSVSLPAYSSAHESAPAPASRSEHRAALIAGVTIGAAVILVLVALFALLCARRRRRLRTPASKPWLVDPTWVHFPDEAPSKEQLEDGGAPEYRDPATISYAQH